MDDTQTGEAREEPSRFSNFFHSIRFKLAAWFVLVLALVLIVFSLFVYYSEVNSVYAQAQTSLNSRLLLAQGYLRGVFAEGAEQGRLPLPGSEHGPQFTLGSSEVMVMTAANGQVVGAWGPVTLSQASALAGIAAQPGGTYTYPINPSTTPPPPPVIQGEQATTIPTQTGSNSVKSGPTTGSQTYLFAAAPVEFDRQIYGNLVLGQPLDPQGQLPRLRLTLLGAALATLLVAMLGSYWLADRTLRPIKSITRTAREISGSDLSRRMNIHSRDELGQLASTFDSMLDRLQAAFARQRQFTADASHELRTPLTIVELETSRALGANRSPDEYKQSMHVIQGENEMMTRLVNELLTLARMDAGQIRINAETLDLGEVALDVAERYTPLAARKGVEIEVGELDELPVSGDRQYLVQMAGNLVDNAIKYGSDVSGGRVSLDTCRRTLDGQEYACLRVSDNGAGIPPEHLPHLFDRFYRVDQARSHNEEEKEGGETSGSGLGLSIVQWIAHAHGGLVTVESQPGNGTTFEILLPLA